MSWSFVGSVITGAVAGTTGSAGNVTLPASVHGGDFIVVAVEFTTGSAAATVAIPGFTTLQNTVGPRHAADNFWVGYRVAGGTFGAATSDTTFTATFSASCWGAWIVGVYRSTVGVGVVTSAEYNAGSAYVTAMPDATLTVAAGSLGVWGYAGHNSGFSGSPVFSGTVVTTTLSNFIQFFQNGSGGAVGMGWGTSQGAPGGVTSSLALDPTDFAIAATEAAGGAATAAGGAMMQAPGWFPGAPALPGGIPFTTWPPPAAYTTLPLVLANNAEGGSNGVTATPGNSGGASGNAFDTVFIGTSCTLAADNTQSAHGSLSYQVATGSTAAVSAAEWTASAVPLLTAWFRIYLYYTSFASATFSRPVLTRSTVSTSASIVISGAGKIVLQDASFTTRATSVTSIPLNQWFRLEGYFTGDAAAGAVSCSLYTPMDSLTAAETITASSINTTGPVTQYQFGHANADANIGPCWMDDIGVSATGYLGPVQPTAYATGSATGAGAVTAAATVIAGATAAGAGSATAAGTVPGVLANNAEGGSNGVTATPGNSGGTSGSAFDAVSVPSGSTIAADSTRAAHGTLSYKFASTTGAFSTYAGWQASLGTAATAWFRLYLYFTANPAGSTPILTLFNSGTTVTCGYVQVQATGQLNVQSHTGGVFTTAASIPLNAWFRIEGYILGDPAAGQAELKLFTAMDSTVAAETQTSAATLNTGGPVDAVRLGIVAAIANAGPFWVDDIGVSPTGYLGPALAAAIAGAGAVTAAAAQGAPATAAGAGAVTAAATVIAPAAAAGAGAGTAGAVQATPGTAAGQGSASAAVTEISAGAAAGAAAVTAAATRPGTAAIAAAGAAANSAVTQITAGPAAGSGAAANANVAQVAGSAAAGAAVATAAATQIATAAAASASAVTDVATQTAGASAAGAGAVAAAGSVIGAGATASIAAAGAATAAATQIATATGTGAASAAAAGAQAAPATAVGAGGAGPSPATQIAPAAAAAAAAATAKATQQATAAAAGAGAAADVATQTAVAAAAGAASVTAAGSVSGQSTASIAGAGAATAVATQAATATAPGAGTAAATGAQAAAATAAGAGSVTAAGSVISSGVTASAAAAGAATAVVTQTVTGTAPAAGTVTASGTQAAKAAAAAAGTVNASGVIPGTASVAGAAAAAAEAAQAATANLAAAGVLSALATQRATATITGAGSVTAVSGLQIAFTVGTLTASVAPAAALTAGGTPAGVLTTATAAGTLTASTAAAASSDAEYELAYAATYGAPTSGTLTAADSRTGGPG